MSELPPWPEALANAKVQFWTCPDRTHRRRTIDGKMAATVEWVDDVAHCLTEGCDRTSLNTTIQDYEDLRHG